MTQRRRRADVERTPEREVRPEPEGDYWRRINAEIEVRATPARVLVAWLIGRWRR